MSENGKVVLLAFKALSEADKAEVLMSILQDPNERRRIDDQLLLTMMGERLQANNSVYAVSHINKRPKYKLPYDSPGRMSGQIRGHQISVWQYPGRTFKTIIDEREYSRLTMELVEGELGLEVHRKANGGNSETLARAIYRHFVDHYNSGHQTIQYDPGA